MRIGAAMESARTDGEIANQTETRMVGIRRDRGESHVDSKNVVRELNQAASMDDLATATLRHFALACPGQPIVVLLQPFDPGVAHPGVTHASNDLSPDWQRWTAVGIPRLVALSRIVDDGLPTTRGMLQNDDVMWAWTNLSKDSWCAFPLGSDDRALGIVLVQIQDQPLSENSLSLVSLIQTVATLVLERHLLSMRARRAEAALQMTRDSAEAVVQATRTFSRAGLDSQLVQQAIADVTQALIGDVSVIRLISANGRHFEVGAVSHPDPEGAAVMRRVFDQADHGVNEGFNGEVFATNHSLFLPRVTPEEVRTKTKPEFDPYNELYGTHALMIMPLCQRDKMIGTITLSRLDPARSYTNEDLHMLEDVANRAEMALDNAQLYEAAHRALHDRDEFLSLAAHELRTPIAAIKGYAQLLARARTKGSEIDVARLDASLVRIDEGVTRLTALTSDLLAVSSIRLGKIPMHVGPIDLGRAAREACDDVMQLLQGHDLDIDVSPRTPLVAADPQKLRSALDHLLENAVHFSPDGGTIRVRIDPHGRGALCSVTDHGIGIAATDLDRVFDPFARFMNASHRNLSGPGLGLHLTQVSIEQMGGQIWVESDGDGAGATFRIWLPPADSPPDALPDSMFTPRLKHAGNGNRPG